METWLVMELCQLGPLSTMVHSKRFRSAATGRPHMVRGRRARWGGACTA
jgi:hypothetical protein